MRSSGASVCVRVQVGAYALGSEKGALPVLPFVTDRHLFCGGSVGFQLLSLACVRCRRPDSRSHESEKCFVTQLIS